MKVIAETRRAHLIWYLRFCYYYLVDTSAGGLLAPKDMIRSVVIASALIWFIRYMYYWNLQFLNNVIINKTEVLLPQAKVTLACLRPLTLNLISTFWLYNYTCWIFML